MDRSKKIVSVIFRGAITKADWQHNFDYTRVSVENPVQDDYEGKLRFIQMHGGFNKYLFRHRRDTNTSKYCEITTKLAQYCAAFSGGDYKVVVCGHSLGGALSTIFSFYASCDERFTKNGPIEVITFGCPLLAGYQMHDAFRHQEDCGKLRYVQ